MNGYPKGYPAQDSAMNAGTFADTGVFHLIASIARHVILKEAGLHALRPSSSSIPGAIEDGTTAPGKWLPRWLP